MEEYNEINWRENLLDNGDNFFNEKDYKQSHMHQFTVDSLQIPELIDKQLSTTKKCKLGLDYPGCKYYAHTVNNQTNSSHLSAIEHQRLINALKVLQSGKLNLNKFEVNDRDLFNNCKASILAENIKYFKWAEESWKKQSIIKMNQVLYKYAITERMVKLQNILKLPQFYVTVDMLPWNFAQSDVAVEMLHIANTLDLGVVSQYLAPLLDDAYFLETKLLPSPNQNNYFSKLPISCDKNIEDFLMTGEADVVISLSALKKIFSYTDTNQLWTMPVIIKIIRMSNGKTKKLIFFDKPLVNQTVTKVDLNMRCHKLLVRANLCRLEGFRYQLDDKLIDQQSCTEPGDDKISHNVAYKLWKLKEETTENSLMLKHRSMKSFNVLVRTKNDACTPCDFGLQSVTVVPKLEYQLKFGANAFTTHETMMHWTDLYFRPSSVLKRVRTHYLTSEVIQVETSNLEKISLEATHQNIKPQSAFVVLYKLLLGLEPHSEGVYLLRHEVKHGKFVALYKHTNEQQSDLNMLDLHDEYLTKTNIIHNFNKPWTPIDPNVLLPAFEYHGHFPGLYKPKLQSSVMGQQVKRKKKKKNIKNKIINNVSA